MVLYLSEDFKSYGSDYSIRVENLKDLKEDRLYIQIGRHLDGARPAEYWLKNWLNNLRDIKYFALMDVTDSKYLLKVR